MENEIKPKVLQTVNELTKEYNKLIKYQKEKLDCLLSSKVFSTIKEKIGNKIINVITPSRAFNEFDLSPVKNIANKKINENTKILYLFFSLE